MGDTTWFSPHCSAKARSSKQMKTIHWSAKAVFYLFMTSDDFSMLLPISTCGCWNLNYTVVIKVKSDLIISLFLFLFPRELIGPDFTETYYTEDGQPVTVSNNSYTVSMQVWVILVSLPLFLMLVFALLLFVSWGHLLLALRKCPNSMHLWPSDLKPSTQIEFCTRPLMLTLHICQLFYKSL